MGGECAEFQRTVTCNMHNEHIDNEVRICMAYFSQKKKKKVRIYMAYFSQKRKKSSNLVKKKSRKFQSSIVR